MLSLSQIEQWHHRRLLVLAWVPAEHLLYKLFIDRIEFERYRRVVVRCVAVLRRCQRCLHRSLVGGYRPTTLSIPDSFLAGAETWKARRCCRTELRSTRALLLSAQGAYFEAIVKLLEYIRDTDGRRRLHRLTSAKL